MFFGYGTEYVAGLSKVQFHVGRQFNKPAAARWLCLVVCIGIAMLTVLVVHALGGMSDSMVAITYPVLGGGLVLFVVLMLGSWIWFHQSTQSNWHETSDSFALTLLWDAHVYELINRLSNFAECRVVQALIDPCLECTNSSPEEEKAEVVARMRAVVYLVGSDRGRFEEWVRIEQYLWSSRTKTVV